VRQHFSGQIVRRSLVVLQCTEFLSHELALDPDQSRKLDGIARDRRGTFPRQRDAGDLALTTFA